MYGYSAILIINIVIEYLNNHWDDILINKQIILKSLFINKRMFIKHKYWNKNNNTYAYVEYLP